MNFSTVLRSTFNVFGFKVNSIQFKSHVFPYCQKHGNKRSAYIANGLWYMFFKSKKMNSMDSDLKCA